MPLGRRYKSLSQNRRNPLRAFHTDRASGPERLATPFYSRRLNVAGGSRKQTAWPLEHAVTVGVSQGPRCRETNGQYDNKFNLTRGLFARCPALRPGANVIPPPMLWAARR